MDQVKPLLVGEAPSKNEVTEQPLMGRVGRRMADVCGVTYEQYLEMFDRVNLLHVRQDTKEKGFEFDHAKAASAAHDLFLNGTIKSDRVVLMLGWRVTRAFFSGVEFKDRRYFSEHRVGTIKFYALPHPSGVNRWWNDPGNYTTACAFMRKIVSELAIEA